jgi:hypothetical protein
MNEKYIATVAKACLEDVALARDKFGEYSAEHKKQLEISTMFIQGSLEEVLMAALPTLEQLSRDALCQTIQTG